MTMVETGSCATMLQIQQKLNLTELPQDQQVESLWLLGCSDVQDLLLSFMIFPWLLKPFPFWRSKEEIE